MKRLASVLLLLVLLLVPRPAYSARQSAASEPDEPAAGFIDFESGVDEVRIRSTVPGLSFTTTAGYDWIYGDWRSGDYHGPYPSGPYFSHGNFFAWLGPNQGAGRIDFTQGCATYLQVWTSSQSTLYMEAFYSNGHLAGQSSVPGNLNTGQMNRLRVDAPTGTCFSYVIIHDTGNYWLIDDLSTDAGGVPAQRPPVILLPGIMGTSLWLEDRCRDESYEVWPAADAMLKDRNDVHLRHLALDLTGKESASWCDQVKPVDVIRKVSLGPVSQEQYAPLIDYLKGMGYTVYPFPYDWRYDLKSTADVLDTFIDSVRKNGRVALVDHSLGGLLARQYVTSSTDRANKVEQVISLGTPFLGAPKSLKVLRWGDKVVGWGDDWLSLGLLNPYTVRDLMQNIPTAYQILPSQRYFAVNGQGYFQVDKQLLDWNGTRNTIMADHNWYLYQGAETFHSTNIDNWQVSGAPVPYRLIVGSGLKTYGTLIEKVVFDWFGARLIVPDHTPTNGDKTVPLVSATLQGNGFNYAGNVPIYYAPDIDHSQLVREPYILSFVAALLATPPNAAALANAQPHDSMGWDAGDPDAEPLYMGPAERFPVASGPDALPPPPSEFSLQPTTVEAGEITGFGVKALHVYDAQGRHTGPTGDGLLELSIPDSDYDRTDNTIHVTVPADGSYQVRALAAGGTPVDIRTRYIKGVTTNLVQRSTIYIDALPGTGQAKLDYVPSFTGAPNNLTVDRNGDGYYEAQVPPTGDVGSGAAGDSIPPDICIGLAGQRGPYGWYVGDVLVTLSATDAGSGVARIDYTTDGGSTVRQYNGPFYVPAAQVERVDGRALDRAGNENMAHALVGAQHLGLPLLLHRGEDGTPPPTTATVTPSPTVRSATPTLTPTPQTPTPTVTPSRTPTTQFPPWPYAAAVHFASPPAIDGYAVEWSGAPATTLDDLQAAGHGGSQPHPTVSDASLSLWAGWDGGTLYFAVSVRDDRLVLSESTNLWEDDAVELGIRIGGRVRQFSFAADGRYSELMDGWERTTPALTRTLRHTAGGWELEVSIPSGTLGVSGLSGNATFPFTVGIWDDDDGGTGDSHLILWGTSTNSGTDKWKPLVLMN